MRLKPIVCAAAWLALGSATAALASAADVVRVELTRATDGTYQIDVTVEHADEGWNHYADAWEVVAPDGTLLATRKLLHPHVGEQPFTRSLSGVAIPESVAQVTIRAHDNVHGYGGQELTVPVPR